MRTVTIEVTEEDIKNGKPMSSCLCPLALAISRCAQVPRVFVFCRQFEINWHKSDLPSSAWHFYYDFDAGRKVKPFKFELQIP